MDAAYAESLTLKELIEQFPAAANEKVTWATKSPPNTTIRTANEITVQFCNGDSFGVSSELVNKNTIQEIPLSEIKFGGKFGVNGTVYTRLRPTNIGGNYGFPVIPCVSEDFELAQFKTELKVLPLQ